MEIFAGARWRGKPLAKLLVICRVRMMLLPGTLLGVWNLISSSTRLALELISASWIYRCFAGIKAPWIRRPEFAASSLLRIGPLSARQLRRCAGGPGLCFLGHGANRVH